MMNMGAPRIRSLINLADGETGEIIQVRGKPEVHRYLYGKGLKMGRVISVNSTGTESFLTVKSGDMISMIDREIAHNIKVRVA